jgi:hypothetical protein
MVWLMHEACHCCFGAISPETLTLVDGQVIVRFLLSCIHVSNMDRPS